MFELSQPIFAKNLKLPFHVDWIQERRLCIEFLAQCNATKAKESNPACQVQVEGLTDDEPPQITVTFVNRVEEKFDATSTPAQTNRTMILEECQSCETEKIFREAGEKWPVIIPEEEHNQPFHGSKVVIRLLDCFWLVEVDFRDSDIIYLKYSLRPILFGMVNLTHSLREIDV